MPRPPAARAGRTSWQRGGFGWESKSRGGDLDRALDQLKRHAPALENPPLPVARNLDRFRIVTTWR